MNVNTERHRAELLRDQVLKTWSPPRRGRGCDATIAQTSIMVGLAFVFGKDLFPILTTNQNEAINSGLKLMEWELVTSRTNTN